MKSNVRAILEEKGHERWVSNKVNRRSKGTEGSIVKWNTKESQTSGVGTNQGRLPGARKFWAQVAEKILFFKRIAEGRTF